MYEDDNPDSFKSRNFKKKGELEDQPSPIIASSISRNVANGTFASRGTNGAPLTQSDTNVLGSNGSHQTSHESTTVVENAEEPVKMSGKVAIMSLVVITVVRCSPASRPFCSAHSALLFSWLLSRPNFWWTLSMASRRRERSARSSSDSSCYP